MVSELDLMIKSVRINNPGLRQEIIKAFRICDRGLFIKQSPYGDEPQHVAHGQTISQPSTIARMLRLLRLGNGMDVLEIGTNTGYHACLVAYLVFPGKTLTIEIFPDLAKRGRENITKLVASLKGKKEANKFSKIKIFAGDALNKRTEIWKHKYDRIYFTAGIEKAQMDAVKEMGMKLLKDKGLLLYPTRESVYFGALEILQKKGNQLKVIRREEGYAFVPLLRKEELKKLYKK